MRIQNKTHWETAALEVLIRAALADAGVKPGQDLVQITYSRGGYRGWCYYGRFKMLPDRPRMQLRVPEESLAHLREELDANMMAYLVRHEVAHWAGLKHSQMGGRLMTPPKPGDLLPSWVPEGWRCCRVETAPKPPIDKDARRAERRIHLEEKVAEYERKLVRAERLLAKWRRKLKAHDAHYKRAALKGKQP